MLRLVRYLKPFTALLLLVVMLLFVQAWADLSLPDYMSRIVNYGIQQGGVEDAAPEALSEQTYTRLQFFLTEAERAQVEAAYTRVDASAADYATLVKRYPALETEALYVRKPLSRSDLKALNTPMARAWLAVSAIERIMQDPQAAAAIGKQLGMDLSKLPPGMDLFSLLPKMPEAQRTALVERLNQQAVALGENMVNQMAVVAVKAEYAALGMDTEALQNAYILRTGGAMLLLALLSAVCTISVGYLGARTAAGVARNLRRDVFAKVTEFSGAEFEKFSTASLITRTTNDVTQMQMVLMMMVRMVFYAPIIGIGAIIRASGKGSSMWWIIAIAVGLLLTLIATVFSVVTPKFKVVQKLIDRLNLVMRENLSGMMVIRAFNTQDHELQRFDRANRDLTDTMLFVSRVIVVMMPLMMLLMNGLMLAIVWVGAHEVAKANMQVGDMMAFMQYALQIVMAFLMLSIMFIVFPRASVSAERIADVLETPLSIQDPPTPRHFPEPFVPRVEFDHVGFRYPGAEENVLCDITFTAEPGQIVGIIGSTGSGKSTLINLIPRFYDVTQGAIRISGVDIREVPQAELRAKVAYVPQRGLLFSGTIESNLRYADEDAADEVIAQAIAIAQAQEVVDSRPEGLAAPIAQGGTNVSGGQRQRLSIARALVKRAPIYIFDDSFSALDFRTEAALRRALHAALQDSTVLIVTQRVSSILHADQIIVLDEGELVGKGTHAELMETCPAYREIVFSQLRQEDLQTLSVAEIQGGAA